MKTVSAILIGLQAAIAARAARDRALTVLLVALWGRIARARVRLERLIAQWRAGTLPAARPARARSARVSVPRQAYPSVPAWLVRKLGYEVVGFGSQLAQALSEAECAAFLAAVPRAGRVLRPLLRMLGVTEVAAVVRKVAAPVFAGAVVLSETGCIQPVPDMKILGT